MIIAVFRRRLRPGCTFEDFLAAWEADHGFGVPARVFAGSDLADERDILTVGFVAVDPAQFEEAAGAVTAQEAVRHDRIDDVVESTELRAFYALGGEYDFTAEPRAVALGSPESLLSALV